MKKEYTAWNMVKNSRFIHIWEPESEEFKRWTLARVDDLVAENREHCNDVVFAHMCNLMTSIAIHEWDLSHGMSMEHSLDRLSKAMEDFMLPMKVKYRKLLGNKLIFRVVGPFIPKKMTSTNDKGFNCVQVPVKGGFGFDTTECVFNTLMRKYGHIELGKRFCAIDEYMYGDIPGVRFVRTGTLCRGCNRCDFRFLRIDAD